MTNLLTVFRLFPGSIVFLPALQVFQMWPLFHGNHFPEMIKLGQLSFTLAVHTAGCERGFSIQNSTLTPSRNRLQEATQDTLMRVQLGPDRDHFNFASAGFIKVARYEGSPDL